MVALGCTVINPALGSVWWQKPDNAVLPSPCLVRLQRRENWQADSHHFSYINSLTSAYHHTIEALKCYLHNLSSSCWHNTNNEDNVMEGRLSVISISCHNGTTSWMLDATNPSIAQTGQGLAKVLNVLFPLQGMVGLLSAMWSWP